MIRYIAFAVALIVGPVGTPATHASNPQQIAWSDLVSDSSFPDPFQELSQKQLNDLAFVVRIRGLLAVEKLAADGPAIKEAAKIEQSLRRDGLDIGWLVAQRRPVRRMREVLAKTVQQSIVGKSVRLSGYVVPVKRVNGLVTEFLLVPDIPTCSQSTPPPPNQIVYVHARNGIAVEGRIAAVSVQGRLEAREKRSILVQPTGPVTFVSAYAISPDEVVRHSISAQRAVVSRKE